MSVPKLRFPEFRDTGEWEEKKLGEIATFLKGKGISKADIDSNGKVPCLRYGELYTHYKEIISDVISKTNLPITELFIGCKNDVIIPSSGETKLDIATASCLTLDNVALGGDINVIRCNQNGIFMSYYLNGCKKFEIAKIAQGDTVVHLYSSQLSKLDITLPPLPEQRKIADCLSSIDDRITAETKKLDTLKAHKKGLMQQLFPAEGETLPKLRFPEFDDSGDWEIKPLKSICSMQAGKFISASNIFEKGKGGIYPCYGGNGLRGYTKTNTHSGRYSLIGRQGALCGNVNLVNGDFYATEHAVVVTPKEDINVNWLFYKLDLLNLNRYATGQAHPGLSVEVLEKVQCIVPTKESEQKKIADCLTSIDEAIAAQSQAIELLKLHKKGLMQQLFPSVEEVKG